MFNSVSRVFLKVQFCVSYWKNFNSLSHVKKFNSLSYMFDKLNRLQFLEINKKCSICKKMFNFFGSYRKKVQFLESFWKTKVECLGSYERKFNSLSHIKKKQFESYLKNKIRSHIFWVNFWVVLKKKFNSQSLILKKGFISLSRSEKSSILRVTLEKQKVQFFFESHLKKKGSVLRVNFC